MTTKARYRPPLAALQHRLLVLGVLGATAGSIAHLGKDAWHGAFAALGVGVGAHLGVLGLVSLASFVWFRFLTHELRARDVERLLDALALTGDEVLLDVGTGDGIVAISAAKRLPSGSVIAIDDWQRPHAGRALSPDTARANASAEGVAARVAVRTAPFDRLELPDASVDVAVACFSLHHLAHETRSSALREMARVLRPGGRLLAAEPARRDEIAATLASLGLEVRRASRTFPRWLFGWVVARKTVPRDGLEPSTPRL
jgi:ubiquinone/menaquinone biosynthesis C-methylase UbiE